MKRFFLFLKESFFPKKGIFVSYRHGDVDDIAGRISDSLKSRFGKNRVFFDTDIPGGVEWENYINERLESCHAGIIIIGPNWLTERKKRDKDESGGSEKDFVEFEVNAILERDPPIPCFPVLVEGVDKLPESDLPDSITKLPKRQWCDVREGRFFNRDVKYLIEQLNPRPEWIKLVTIGIMILILLVGSILVWKTPVEVERDPTLPTMTSNPHENSLGTKFVPLEGTDILFSKTETTVKEFRRYAKERGVKIPAPTFGKDRSGKQYRQAETHPVVNVSWYDAKAFCEWLTQKEQEKGWLLSNQKYRLPTDAEWSLAVGIEDEPDGSPKAKSDNPVKEVYPWDGGNGVWPPDHHVGNYGGEESITDGLPEFLNGYRDYHPITSPVGAYPAGNKSISDLGGNVWEWCECLYDIGSTKRVLRGGSFRNVHPEKLPSTFRNYDEPGFEDNNVGFRCVIDLGLTD